MVIRAVFKYSRVVRTVFKYSRVVRTIFKYSIVLRTVLKYSRIVVYVNSINSLHKFQALAVITSGVS